MLSVVGGIYDFSGFNSCSQTSKMEQILFADEIVIPMDVHTASSIGNDDRVRDIIESASDKASIIDSKNADGWTPLMYASQSGSQRVVLCLIEEGASTSSVNRDGQTALMLSAMYGHIESAFLLVDNGANIDAVDNDNWTPLFYSVSDGHRGVVQLLLEKKCKVNVVDETCGMTPLMYAAVAGHEFIALDLMRNGANPSMRSKGGFTALDIANQRGNVKVQQAIESHLMHSKPPPAMPNIVSNPKTVEEMLANLGLSKYYPIFEKQAIDLGVFWTLTDADLKDIGIDLLGPRRKITNEISKRQENFKEKSSNDKLKTENFNLQKRIKELNLRMVQVDTQRKTVEAKVSQISQAIQKYLHLFNALQDRFHRKNDLLEVTLQTKHMISQEMNDLQNSGTISQEATASILNLFNVIECFIKEQRRVVDAFSVEAQQFVR